MNSPCINVCQIDPASGLCTGCLRTLDEIAAWAGLSADKRTEILADVERRARSRNRTAGA